MSPAATPLARIPVGVVVARRKAASQWIDFTWTPDAVLHGVPEAEPWTVLSQGGEDGETTMFYAGSAEVELYRSETTYYRDNLATGSPLNFVDDGDAVRVFADVHDREENELFELAEGMVGH